MCRVGGTNEQGDIRDVRKRRRGEVVFLLLPRQGARQPGEIHGRRGAGLRPERAGHHAGGLGIGLRFWRSFERAL